MAGAFFFGYRNKKFHDAITTHSFGVKVYEWGGLTCGLKLSDEILEACSIFSVILVTVLLVRAVRAFDGFTPSSIDCLPTVCGSYTIANKTTPLCECLELTSYYDQ